MSLRIARILTGAARDGVYAVNLKLIARGHWRNVGIDWLPNWEKIRNKKCVKVYIHIFILLKEIIMILFHNVINGLRNKKVKRIRVLCFCRFRFLFPGRTKYPWILRGICGLSYSSV